ncbi:MAG TPA: hypothetical protein VF163_16660 [Micromonosporaceae bacterium]
MAEIVSNSRRDADQNRGAGSSLAELNNQLNRAYLSGDGAAVERVMALIAEARQTTGAEPAVPTHS